jgi:glyoxylase-like metal-dependent hydrolase (beta-lactamase superfamily II)
MVAAFMNPMTPRIERIEGTVMAVNSYLIHDPGGIIVVDGQLTIADADAVRGAIERSGQKAAAMVITHPHPDQRRRRAHRPAGGPDPGYGRGGAGHPPG